MDIDDVVIQLARAFVEKSPKGTIQFLLRVCRSDGSGVNRVGRSFDRLVQAFDMVSAIGDPVGLGLGMNCLAA